MSLHVGKLPLQTCRHHRVIRVHASYEVGPTPTQSQIESGSNTLIFFESYEDDSGVSGDAVNFSDCFSRSRSIVDQHQLPFAKSLRPDRFPAFGEVCRLSIEDGHQDRDVATESG